MRADYHRANQIPPGRRSQLPDAIERLIRLYDTIGNQDAAVKWRAERRIYPAEQAPPPRMVK